MLIIIKTIIILPCIFTAPFFQRVWSTLSSVRAGRTRCVYLQSLIIPPLILALKSSSFPVPGAQGRITRPNFPGCLACPPPLSSVGGAFHLPCLAPGGWAWPLGIIQSPALALLFPCPSPPFLLGAWSFSTTVFISQALWCQGVT